MCAAHGSPALPTGLDAVVRIVYAKYSDQIAGHCGLVGGTNPGYELTFNMHHAALHACGGEAPGQFRTKSGNAVGDDQVHLTQAPLGEPVHENPTSCGALGGHMKDVEDFPAALRCDGQHHVKGLPGHSGPAHLGWS